MQRVQLGAAPEALGLQGLFPESRGHRPAGAGVGAAPGAAPRGRGRRRPRVRHARDERWGKTGRKNTENYEENVEKPHGK